MWKFVFGISVTLSTFAIADDAPVKSSVSADCCGRLRHGIVAVGCETTGTTITFNRIVWELQLNDDAAREFAKKHHKESVVVNGLLRRVVGVETKERWIIDVKSMSELDPVKDNEGAKLTIQGTLMEPLRPVTDDGSRAKIEVDDQIWPIVVASDAAMEDNARSLVGESIVAKASVERTSEEDADSVTIIRVNVLKRAPKAILQHR